LVGFIIKYTDVDYQMHRKKASDFEISPLFSDILRR